MCAIKECTYGYGSTPLQRCDTNTRAGHWRMLPRIYSFFYCRKIHEHFKKVHKYLMANKWNIRVPFRWNRTIFHLFRVLKTLSSFRFSLIFSLFCWLAFIFRKICNSPKRIASLLPCRSSSSNKSSSNRKKRFVLSFSYTHILI